MLGSKKTWPASVVQTLTSISPASKPIYWPEVERVEIDISKQRATILGPESQILDMANWRCEGAGVLVGTARRDGNAEMTFNSKVDVRIELSLAADGTLIAHSVQQFSQMGRKSNSRESWYRFHPAPTTH